MSLHEYQLQALLNTLRATTSLLETFSRRINKIKTRTQSLQNLEKPDLAKDAHKLKLFSPEQSFLKT